MSIVRVVTNTCAFRLLSVDGRRSAKMDVNMVAFHRDIRNE